MQTHQLERKLKQLKMGGILDAGMGQLFDAPWVNNMTCDSGGKIVEF